MDNFRAWSWKIWQPAWRHHLDTTEKHLELIEREKYLLVFGMNIDEFGSHLINPNTSLL